jgi:hypothetical protein
MKKVERREKVLVMSTPRGYVRYVRSVLFLAAALGLAGCMQLETKIHLNEDGSATVTERLNFSRKLLDMTGGQEAGLQLEPLLAQEAALERMKDMGKGVSLVSHKTQEGAKGSRESIAVYRAEDLSQFTYVSPLYLGTEPGLRGLKFAISPYLSYRYTGEHPGILIVGYQPADIRKRAPKGAPPGRANDRSPLGLQTFRELTPLFRDMMEDFLLRVTLTCYSGQSATLIDVNDTQSDKYGYPILENEEVMSEILQWRLDSDRDSPNTYGPFLTDNLANRGMFAQRGWGGSIWIPPSLPLFKTHFEGKILDWTGSGNPEVRARGKAPADFERIGWQPKKR